MIYTDTSFLFALYQQGDAFHVSAKKLMARMKEPIALTLLGEFGAPWKRRRNPVRGRTSPGKGRSNRKQAGQATGVTRWSEAPADKGP